MYLVELLENFYHSRATLVLDSEITEIWAQNENKTLQDERFNSSKAGLMQ